MINAYADRNGAEWLLEGFGIYRNPETASVLTVGELEKQHGPLIDVTFERAEQMLIKAAEAHGEKVITLVLQLHSPNYGDPGSRRHGLRGQCMGCEFSGHAAEAPEWPCETVKLINRHVTKLPEISTL